MKTSAASNRVGHLLACVASGAACAFLVADPPKSSPPASGESTGKPTVIPGVEEARQATPPLLREGSFITRTIGTLHEDPKRHEWTFTPQAVDRSGLTRDFILLPNEALGEATRTARLAPAAIAFELTGEIFIYHGRNYVLPSLMSPFVAQPAAQQPVTKPAPSAPPAVKEPPPALPQDEEAIAKELERRLAEKIDRLPKPALAPPTNRRESAETSGGSPTATSDAPKAPPMRGDTQIQSRRGQLVRDNATGGWRYVFEGQLAEGGEPSMEVLPCLALERIETSVRQSDVALPLVVTGSTTVFEGRTYLLPSIFRVARGGKGINP